MRNTVLNTDTISGIKAQLDTQVKKVLAQKIVLAWILQGTAAEFAHMNYAEIAECIEKQPKISVIPVDPGKTNIHPAGKMKEQIDEKTNPQIAGRTNEDSVEGEGTLFFDIVFEVYIRYGEIYKKILVNIEPQKDFRPGYEIVTRGEFYGARMLSAQKLVEFTHSDYDSIKKVYSIWLCMNAPKYIGNAISEYIIHKTDLESGLPDIEEAYDKLAVVIVAMNPECENENPMIGMLNTLLSDQLSAEEKVRRLRQEYGMELDDETEEEIGTMCNLSDLAVERGIRIGEARGQERAMNLIKRLAADGKSEWITLAAESSSFREKMYLKYGI